MLPGSEFWFAAQVTPRHEKKVDAILGHKSYEHFLPTQHVRRKWSDRVKIVEEPLFPGYVFFRTRRAQAGAVLATPGIIRIVSSGGGPHPVSDDEMEALKRIVHAKRDVCSFPYLSAGQRVQVVAGPLRGITGIIIKFKKHDRLIMSVDLIMKSIAVEIDGSEVVPVQHAAIA